MSDQKDKWKIRMDFPKRENSCLFINEQVKMRNVFSKRDLYFHKNTHAKKN